MKLNTRKHERNKWSMVIYISGIMQNCQQNAVGKPITII